MTIMNRIQFVPQYKGGSPLALEAKQVYLKNKSLIEGLVKKVIT